MTRTTTTQPLTVPAGATQSGDIPDRWSWVEAAVWTERMLTALETGIKRGKWFSLSDKVYALPNLYAAFARVKANAGAAGVDQQTIEMFEQNLDANVANLSAGLREGSYRPAAVRRKMIPKLGSRELRPLGIPTVRDRVVQTALRNVLEPSYNVTRNIIRRPWAMAVHQKVLARASSMVAHTSIQCAGSSTPGARALGPDLQRLT